MFNPLITQLIGAVINCAPTIDEVESQVTSDYNKENSDKDEKNDNKDQI